MTLVHHTSICVALAMFLVVGCGEEETEAAVTEPTAEAEAPAAEEPAPEEPAAAPAPAPGGGTPCDRAVRCCEAYVGLVAPTIPADSALTLSVESTCGGARTAQGGGENFHASCIQYIDMWRQGLESRSLAVPADCAAQ